jgi:ribosomal protein L7/L12
MHLKIELGDDLCVTTVETYEQAMAVAEFAARNLPRSTRYRISFDSGPARLKVIREIRSLTGLGLADSKNIADNGRYEVVGKPQADAFVAAVERGGGSVSPLEHLL